MEFSYRIVLNDEITVEIEKLNANYTVIDGKLEPNRTYDVVFIALLSYDGESRAIVSEQTQFKMLPQSTAKNIGSLIRFRTRKSGR